MFRHVVLFKWTEGVGPDRVEAVTTALEALPAAIPALRGYEVGPATSGTHDFAVVADFDDEDGWRSYDEHPDHVRVREELILPLVADRAIVRYVVDERRRLRDVRP